MPMPSQIKRRSNERAKAELQFIKSNANYEYVCRCCLKSDADFIQLDTLMVSRNLEGNDESDKIPLLRCLLFCIRTDNKPDLPQLICTECSKTLQISYYFLQNALRAHEILCRKLCSDKPTHSRLGVQLNGNFRHETAPKEVPSPDSKARSQKSGNIRHECKICGTVVHNRMELKQHIRLHRDTIIQNCSMCIFSTIKQSHLMEHYRVMHNLTTAQAEDRINLEQLEQKLQEGPKVCTLEDIEMLIPTVLTPEDYAQPKSEYNIEPHSMPNKETSANNVSIGTEFLVMPDGSLQQVNGGGVLFEYIDDSKRNVAPTSNLNLQTLLGNDNLSLDPMDIDINDLIVEENLPQIKTKPRPGKMAAATFKHKCTICMKSFPTLARLKSHQLTHSNLPKFHCDQCNFFSLLSSDLAYHHKVMHQEPPTPAPVPAPAQTSTVEQGEILSCDLCLFETRISNELYDHYTDKHMVRPTEVQLRPCWSGGAETVVNTAIPQLPTDQGQNIVNPYPVPVQQILPQTATNIIAQQPAQANTTATITPMGDISVVVDATPLFFPNGTQTAVTTVVPLAPPPPPPPAPAPPLQASTVPSAIVDNSNINCTNTTTNTYVEAFPEISANENLVQTTEQTTIPPIPNPNLPTTFGDMQDFIDNTDVAAICTIPADGMPVVDGDDIVIDNNNISLDFDAENLFGEFEEEEEGGGEAVVGAPKDVVEEEAEEVEEEEEEEDVDNDDENDNNDDATDQNLLLTSDDDDVDDFDDEQSRHLQKPYCIYCNKKFTSQYKFENHMFVHRGLAPYRCELCTNLYNMKRLLIRHYKTVHKRMPTRDMVQAKGDKITVARSNKETIQVDVNKDPMLMCAKCPFECESDADMKKHLNAHHGINDGVSVHANEVFIIRKLPFECPRCIRSFAAKRTLTRHLQRSHLVDTIIELTGPAATIPSPSQTETNAVANEIVPLNNAVDATAEKEADTPVAAPVPDDTAMVPVAADTSMGAAAAANAGIDGINVTECDGYTPAAEELPSHVLNGSDKLLTAATMEPSPIKDGRTRLPRTPIFVCKLCNKTFDELSKLVKHETEMHSGGEPRRVAFQHKCSTCHATFRTLTLLKFHMKRHLARRFQCNRCPKCFIKKPELERHILMKHAEKHDTSSKDKAFRCSLNGCTKTFNFKHHMVRHQNAVHLKVRHICNICEKEMINSFNLRVHMRIHRGNGQSYKCPNCDKTYVRRGPLRLHARQAHQLELTESDWAGMLCNNVRSNSLHVKKPSRKKKTSEAPAGD
ncbi:ras-responsive element-binding protein 1 isoform X2 [Drosophila willistoni]|uniref:ras-responsive element-binding protein 1 isoform X2 n=1 Tax=Drosophila willistoni TaxID=7260 RepID=UPI000C26D1AA|nr:ras-responsive element-binding protein 1 isoform X2 [Drosophila willistoni]